MLDGSKTACNARLPELRDAKVMCKHRDQRRHFVNDTNGAMNVQSMTDAKRLRSALQRRVERRFRGSGWGWSDDQLC